MLYNLFPDIKNGAHLEYAYVQNEYLNMIVFYMIYYKIDKLAYVYVHTKKNEQCMRDRLYTFTDTVWQLKLLEYASQIISVKFEPIWNSINLSRMFRVEI